MVRQFFAFEGVPFAGDVDAVGTVGAVHLAEVGEHYAQEVDLLAVGQAGLVDSGGGIFAGVGVGDAGGSAGGVTAGEFVAVRWFGGGPAGGEDVIGGGHSAEDV